MVLKTGDILKQLIDDGRVTDPASAKGRVLAAAAKLFAEKGYASSTVRDLAAEIGIQSGSIFHHFKNKEEILYAVMSEVSAAMTDAMRARLAETESCEAQLRVLLHNELTFIHGPTGHAAKVLVNEWRALSPERQAEILRDRADYVDMWQTVAEAAWQSDVVTVPADLLMPFVQGAIAWTVNWYDPDGPLGIEAVVDQLMALLIHKKVE